MKELLKFIGYNIASVLCLILTIYMLHIHHPKWWVAMLFMILSLTTPNTE